MISFDQIMMNRAAEMAKRGMKPEGAPPEQPPQEGQAGQPGKMPEKGALMRRMKPPVQPGADPRLFLDKLPPEIAALAVRYRRV